MPSILRFSTRRGSYNRAMKRHFPPKLWLSPPSCCGWGSSISAACCPSLGIHSNAIGLGCPSGSARRYRRNRSARLCDRQERRARRAESRALNMHFLNMLEQLPFSIWVRESSSIWAFPTFLVLHTIGMAMVAGLSTMLDLALLGFWPKAPVKPLERLYPLMWLGFGINAVTGTALLIAD